MQSVRLVVLVADRLAKARRAARLTQDQLARLAGVSLQTIRGYEARLNIPRLTQLYAISAALQVEVYDLLPSAREVEA